MGATLSPAAPKPKFVATVAAVNDAQRTFPGRHGRVKTGMCISGGGSRSASCTIGALRVLEEIGLMSHIDILSAVSGSSWATSVYMFADGETGELLGGATHPSELTLEVLDREPPPLARGATVWLLSSFFGSLNDFTPLHRKFQDVISEAWLKPFGLDGDKFLAGSQEDKERIIENNPLLKDTPFLVPRADRPRTWVVGGTLLAPRGFEANDHNAVGFQMSPDFVGTPLYPFHAQMTYVPARFRWFYKRKLTGVVVGGGLVETFAFGGKAPSKQVAGEKVQLPAPPKPFTLGDMIGISSMASAPAFLQISPTFSASAPMMRYWPVASPQFPKASGDRVYNVGDGGNVDNSGLFALLQRGVRRVVWFAFSWQGLDRDFDFCAAEPGFDPVVLGGVGQLLDKFGFGRNGLNSLIEPNQIFSKEELQPILCELQTLRRKGKPGVVRRTLQVLKNEKWCIQGGYEVELLLIYLEQVTDFEEQLPQDTRDELAKGEDGSFPNYPFLATVGLNWPEPMGYTHRQVNLLTAQMEHTVREASDVLRSFVLAPAEATVAQPLPLAALSRTVFV